MIYLVSGWLRHGTSMMMACLEAGGIETAWSAEREREAQQRFGDALYRGNEAYRELSRTEMEAPDFPLPYEGKAVKCLRHLVLQVPAAAYRVVYMRRDGEETRQSAQALFGRRLPPEWGAMVERETDRILGILQQRRDMEVVELRYRDVVTRPLAAFYQLQALGWPIDPEKAASAVEPERCRYRVESLQAGA